MKNYKHTLHLPTTPFGIKANLPETEPVQLSRWQQLGIYDALRRQRCGAQVYTVHDGPPYANGHIHVGHGQGHVSKDIVVRCQSMLGRNAKYVPGWDCHGLPIEWKVEQAYREAGQLKGDVPVLEFREACRKFAQSWVDIQSKEFMRLGVQADWANPYVTMSSDNEAAILRELYACIDKGLLQRKLRPVLWSVAEETALAEAEAEYREKETEAVFVQFPITEGPEFLKGVHAIIWTTTPWTLPANRGIAFNSSFTYAVVEVTGQLGPRRFLVADSLVEQVFADRPDGFTVIDRHSGKSLTGCVCQHPMHASGYHHQVPLVHADFVTCEQGTGLVHMAPAYGVEEFELNLSDGLGLEVAELLNDDGTYRQDVPVFAGQHIFSADKAIFDVLRGEGMLWATQTTYHSYPHSWRSKQPLIYRATPQWFISMDATGLRRTALAEIDATTWIPEKGGDRIRQMIGERPDWCISRQRRWGVPIAIFVNKVTGEVLNDKQVNARIMDAVRQHGSDIWYDCGAEEFLGAEYDSDAYCQVFDVLDVWFESGCSHAFTLEDRSDQSWPADLYLEGSDQHRGWFQASLLESCATRGKAPFRTVVTHGFVNDEAGKKMSKSEGNVLSPVTIADSYGADVFRLWAATVDWKKDMRLGEAVLQQMAEMYRKIRNTLRFIAGNLDRYNSNLEIDLDDLPVLERFVLERLSDLDREMRKAIETFEYGAWLGKLYRFCDQDLSRFYFEIRKDSLYCDSTDSAVRCASQKILSVLYRVLSRWWAPTLPFSMDELFGIVEANGQLESIHLDCFPQLPRAWSSTAASTRLEKILELRSAFLSAMEEARNSGEVKKASEAAIVIARCASEYSEEDIRLLVEVCGVAEVIFVPTNNPGQVSRVMEVKRSANQSCPRCRLANIPQQSSPGILCERCAGVVEMFGETAM